MPAFCCVVGCGSRSKRDPVRFFRIPARTNFTHQIRMNELTGRRRHMWLAAIHRADFSSDTKLKNALVCSKHFITGEPAKSEDVTDPDWVPSVNMGYINTSIDDNAVLDSGRCFVHVKVMFRTTVFEINLSVNNTNCCVYGCHSKKGRDTNLSFHRFPGKQKSFVYITSRLGIREKVDRYQAWMMKLRMEKPTSKFMRVCSRHFTTNDYILPGVPTKKPRLKLIAVPSRNLPKKRLVNASLLSELKMQRKVKQLRTDMTECQVQEDIVDVRDEVQQEVATRFLISNPSTVGIGAENRLFLNLKMFTKDQQTHMASDEIQEPFINTVTTDEEIHWFHDQITALIEEFRMFPSLYSSKLENQHSKHTNKIFLRDIAEKLDHLRPGVTISDIVHEWNRLKREYYIHKSQLQYTTEEPNFKYFDLMRFLDEDDASATAPEDPLALTTELKVKEEPSLFPTQKSDSETTALLLENGLQFEHPLSEGGADLFGTYVTQRLQQIADERLHQETMLEIHKILFRSRKFDS